MARLVEAVRPEARLVLVGDPGQLTSIEAGAVLGDIVGPATRGLRMRPAAREALAAATGAPVPATDPPVDAGIGDGIVVLERVHRYGAGIARLAEAIRSGDADARARRARGRARGRHVGAGGPGRGGRPGAGARRRRRGRAGRDRGGVRRRGAARRSPRWPGSGCSAPTGAGRTGRRPGCAASKAGSPRRSPGFARRGRVVRGAPAARDGERLRRCGSSTATRASWWPTGRSGSPPPSSAAARSSASARRGSARSRPSTR